VAGLIAVCKDLEDGNWICHVLKEGVNAKVMQNWVNPCHWVLVMQACVGMMPAWMASCAVPRSQQKAWLVVVSIVARIVPVGRWN